MQFARPITDAHTCAPRTGDTSLGMGSGGCAVCGVCRQRQVRDAVPPFFLSALFFNHPVSCSLAEKRFLFARALFFLTHPSSAFLSCYCCVTAAVVLLLLYSRWPRGPLSSQPARNNNATLRTALFRPQIYTHYLNQDKTCMHHLLDSSSAKHTAF